MCNSSCHPPASKLLRSKLYCRTRRPPRIWAPLNNQPWILLQPNVRDNEPERQPLLHHPTPTPCSCTWVLSAPAHPWKPELDMPQYLWSFWWPSHLGAEWISSGSSYRRCYYSYSHTKLPNWYFTHLLPTRMWIQGSHLTDLSISSISNTKSVNVWVAKCYPMIPESHIFFILPSIHSSSHFKSHFSRRLQGLPLQLDTLPQTLPRLPLTHIVWEWGWGSLLPTWQIWTHSEWVSEC